jgi:hypothetical protein
MGSEITTLPQLSAFIVPFADLDADHAVFTGTESNPSTHPIETTAGTSSALAFVASGDPEAGRDIRIRVTRGGVPAGVAGLALAWRNTAVEDYLGHDAFGLPTAYRQVAWSTSTTLGYAFPDVVALPSGVLVCCFDEPISATRRAVKVRRWDPDALAWSGSSTDVYTDPTTLVGYGLHPCMTVLPSGRIVLFHLRYQATTWAQVWKWYSDDDGVTWTKGQVDCLNTAIDYGTMVPLSMRCAYGRGEIALVVGYVDAGDGRILHYGSRDGGARFTLVETLVKAAGGGAQVALCYAKGQFLTIMPDSVEGANSAIWRGGGATDVWAAVPDSGYMFDFFVASDHCALCTDEADNIYFITGYPAGGITYSADAGSTWAPICSQAPGGDNATQWDPPGALGPQAVRLAATYHRGRICLLHNYGGATPTFGIVETQLGGYSTVTFPERIPDGSVFGVTQPSSRLQVPWGNAWAGWKGRLDAYTNWANADTGAPTYGTTLGYEAIACGAGDVSIVEGTQGAADYFEIIAGGRVLQNSGTSVVELRSCSTSGAGALTRITLTISTTTIVLDDDIGAGTASRTYTAGNDVEFIVALKGQKCAAWYRVVDDNTSRRWINVGTLTGLTETAGAPPANRIRRIVSASSGANWYEFRRLFDNSLDIDKPISDGQSNPGDLHGRPAVGNFGGVYLDDGVSVQVVDGPGDAGETFMMEGGGARPIERAFPLVSPSPQDYAEIENGDDIDVGIEWDDTRDPGNDAIGVYLDCPVYAAELWIDEGAGAAKIGDLNTAFQIEFVRRGDTLVTPESGSAGHLGYIEGNELAGGWVVIDPDGADYTARITGNTAGRLDDGASLDEKRATIFISGLDPAAPTSGTVRVIPPRSVTVAALFGHRAILSAFVRINPTNLRTGYPAPPWGTIRIRAFNLGRVDFLGWSPARDHSVQRESVVSVTDMPSGARWSRRMNPRTRRIVEFSVSSDSIDISKSRGVHDDDYLRASQTAGSEPVAARHDAPLLVAGLLDEIDGAGGLVTWVPAWDPNGDDVQSWCLQHAGGALHGRIVSEARLENVVGLPHADQVVRGPRVVLEEEI